jgi:hypothetical protein
MAANPKKGEATPCQWISGPDAFKEFATHKGKTQSARHIKPLHWYIACRLVLEGGFRPDDITPRPPFVVEERKVRGRRGRKGYTRYVLHYDPTKGGAGEQVILGGLKTKNVDVVVAIHPLGPVLAVSCKGVTKAFRNLTNRMEETIGECTNLHITYPAMVIGYFALMRANRTVQDARDAPELDPEDTPTELSEDEADVVIDGDPAEELTPRDIETIKANDIAIHEDGRISDGIVRFHEALQEMTGRRGLRDEISRYEAMSIVLVEPKGAGAGSVLEAFPEADSTVRMEQFFAALYQRYHERFVLGAPVLVDRGWTTRLHWDPNSPVFARADLGAVDWPQLDFEPRLADPQTP